MAKGGITPALVTDRGPNWVVNPLSIDPVFTVNSVFTFNETFRLPWTVGAELAFNTSRRGQLFLEYAYSHAKGKLLGDPAEAAELFSAYTTHAGYLGARWYLGPWRVFSCCGLLAPYVGFKTGLVWQKQVNFDLITAGIPTFTTPYWFSRTVISAGLQIGAEWWFTRCWSLVLQGEFVATQGPRTNTNIVFPVSEGGPSNVSVGRFGLLITFPVTLGLRWTF
jgi:hypothetical protein